MVYVSLTTTFDRAEICFYTILSLLRQRVMPDKIVLSISNDPFLKDKGFKNEPEWVDFIKKSFGGQVFEVRWVSNTGPYRKLFPLLKVVNDEDILITVDDDIIYHKEWLETLLKESTDNPGYVIASKVRIKKKNFLGLYTSYMTWPLLKKESVLSKDVVVIGCGGVLYKKKFFKEIYIDNSNYLSVAETSDDIWFSKIIEKSGVPVKNINSSAVLTSEIEHNLSLTSINTFSSNGFFGKVMVKVVIWSIGWLGLSLCKNDIHHKKVEEFFERTSGAV